jgi:hypothetical protein
MASFGTTKSLFGSPKENPKRGIREGKCCLLDMLASKDLLNREENLFPKEDSHEGISGENRQIGSGSMVHGRRVNKRFRNSLFLSEREPSNCSMVQKEMGNCVFYENRQTCKIAFSAMQGRECLEIAPISISVCAPKSLVQIQTSSCKSVGRQIIDVKKTKVLVRTYDIGVENTHCFFANGILVHNCQHDAAATMSDLHQDTASKMSLGLTATPFRTDRIKLSFDKIINDCGVRFLIEKGYLSQFERLVIPDWLPATVATRFLEDRERWGKSVIYMKNKDLCYETQERLVAGGVKAAVMLGSQSNDERNELFEQFEDGDLQVLINVYLLSEGFDCPALNTVWVRDSGKLCSQQMSGRVLRKDPKNPAKVANIVQSQQTWYPYTKCAKAQREYLWESAQWRSIEPSELSDKIAQIVQDEILPVPVFLPPYLDFAGKTVIRVGKNGEVNVSKRRRKENVVMMPGDFVPDDFDNADEGEYLE